METSTVDCTKDLKETVDILHKKKFNISSLFIYIQIKNYEFYFKNIVETLKKINNFDEACSYFNILPNEVLFISVSDICCGEKTSGFVFLNPIVFFDLTAQQMAKKYKIFKKYLNIYDFKDNEKIYIKGRTSLPKLIDIKFIDQDIYSMSRILISGNINNLDAIFEKYQKIFNQKINTIKFNLIGKCKNDQMIDIYSHESILITEKYIIVKIKCKDELERSLSYIYNAYIDMLEKKKFFDIIDDDTIWNKDIDILKDTLKKIFL